METYKQNPCPSHRDREFFCLIEVTTMIVTLQQLSTEYTCIFDHAHSLTSPTSQCCDNTLTLHSSSVYQDSASSQNQRSLCWQHINALILANSPNHIMGAICDSGRTWTLFYRRDSFFEMFMHERKKVVR